MNLQICFFANFLLYYIDAYKILVWYPVPVKSLSILGEGYVRSLIKAGHEITYVSSNPLKENIPQKNFRQIDVSANNRMVEEDEMIKISYIMQHGQPESSSLYYQSWAYDVAAKTFGNPVIKEFLENNDEHFDLVIADFYETEVYSSLAELYDCPMMWCWSMGPHWIILRLIDDFTNPAYTVDYISSNIPPLSFNQRVQELWAQVEWYFYKMVFTMPQEEALYKKVFEPLFNRRGKKLTNYKDIIYNSSFIFVNDYNIGGNIPNLPQNVKLVGGYYINNPTSLSKDLQEFMDMSEHGVIYFSMGSEWKSSSIPKEVTEGILNIFKDLKQNVIWKYEEKLHNTPNNVLLLKWAPQRSILAHPHLRLFITHGGQLSSTEIVHFGVPTVGIPISIDQFLNVNKAVSLGYAVRVELNKDLLHNLRDAIHKVLYDPGYKKRAIEVSATYHDRVVSAEKEVVHWVEHVIRTRGALHLRPPSLLVPWYQKMHLHLSLIILFLAAVTCLLINIFCTNLFCKTKAEKSKSA